METVGRELLYKFDGAGCQQIDAAGAGTYPIVGSPRHVAEELVKINQAGFTAATVSFVNFKNELPYFIETVMPLLREAGVRN